MSRKLLSILLMICLLMSMASCDNSGSSESPAESNMDPVSETTPFSAAGETEPEKPRYSTKLITLPVCSKSVHAFTAGGSPCFISEYYDFDSDNEPHFKNTLFICNYEGDITSSCELEDCDRFGIQDVCGLGNGGFVAVGFDAEHKTICRIYDLDGKLIKQTDDKSNPILDFKASVGKTEDGFVVSFGDKVVRYDSDGNKTDEIIMEPADQRDYSLNCVFEQNGKCYGCGLTEIDEGLTMMYYTIDFEIGAIELYFRPSVAATYDIYYDYSDYHRGTCGMDADERIVKINMEEQNSVILAEVNDMQICPPTYEDEEFYEVLALDEEHYFIPYLYIGKDLDITEIALLVRDDSSNFDQRIPIVIQGAGISNETVLKNAAYYYNTSQDKYAIKIDELATRYDLNSPESMKRNKLNIMTQYMNGNTPDIFCGNFFDYNYFGDNNLVTDISSYFADDPVLKNMIRKDGKLYQVYAGYTLEGFWGRASDYSGNTDIMAMPALKSGQVRFAGGFYSPDVFYRAVGNDLADIYHDGKLTKENVFSVAQKAVEEGGEPDYDNPDGNVFEAEDVRKGKVSLYINSIGSPAAFVQLQNDFGDQPEYVGYPSIGGSVHPIRPICLMAVSESTDHKDVCIDFIKTVMTLEVQRKICASGSIPVNRDVLLEMIEVLKDPDNATADQTRMYKDQFIHDDSQRGKHPVVPLTQEQADKFLEAVNLADNIEVYDWGLWIMARDEIKAYYSQGKSIDQIADTLYSKYLLYAQENY